MQTHTHTERDRERENESKSIQRSSNIELLPPLVITSNAVVKLSFDFPPVNKKKQVSETNY